MASGPPNLVLIQADQLKPQVLGAWGGPADAPHLDRLGEEGVLFENAYCNFPLCAPSRFSMLAGMLPSRIGAYDNGAEYAAQIPTVAHYLSLAGYHTCLSGKQHFVGPDMLHGFHERLVPELYPTSFSWTPDWSEVRMESNSDSSGVTRAGVCGRSVQMDHDEAVLHRANAKLHDYARGDGRPFFLAVSFTHPHEPYYCLRRCWDRYRHEDVPMPETALRPETERSPHTERILRHHSLLDGGITEAHVRTARHAYLANVSYLDEMAGSLLDTLKLTGLADDTVIVVTADHGDMLGEHGLWFKKHFSDHCMRVPLIVHAPARLAPGRRSENVSLVDLLPTLCDLAGFDARGRAPELLDGESLVPLCEDPAAARSSPVFAELTSEGVSAPMFMVREGRYKLVTGGGVPAELFDLDDDPHERRDIAGRADAGKVRERLEGHAGSTWDASALDAAVRLSQRRRRLVGEAHRRGPAPVWEHRRSDAETPWLLRGEGLYNDWAWRGIEGACAPARTVAGTPRGA